MKKNKIISYKLRHQDSEILGQELQKYDGLSVEEIQNIDQVDQYDHLEIAAFFYHIDESFDLIILEKILKTARDIPVNIILKNKNFDFLMLCYRYQVCSVFEKNLDSQYLERVLVQIDLLAMGEQSNIPTKVIMDLFSTPTKVKTDGEMYNILGGYFNQFEEVNAFALIKSVKNASLELVGGDISADKIASLKLPEIVENYIGVESTIDINEETYIMACVLASDDSSLWMMVNIAPGKKDYILNNLFYKYLENIHIYRMNKEKEQHLSALASTDDVTGLYNQRKLSEDLAQAVAFHEAQGKNFSIMFIDVDHFKSVNDNYGHVVGSKLLQGIGDVLSHVLRASDDIYRYGGDEFVVLMPLVNIQTVLEIATRVLMKIKNTKFDIGEEEPYRLSVSIGIAEYPTDATSAIEIIRFADEMMYKSKKSGRGKVFHIKEV